MNYLKFLNPLVSTPQYYIENILKKDPSILNNVYGNENKYKYILKKWAIGMTWDLFSFSCFKFTHNKINQSFIVKILTSSLPFDVTQTSNLLPKGFFLSKSIFTLFKVLNNLKQIKPSSLENNEYIFNPPTSIKLHARNILFSTILNCIEWVSIFCIDKRQNTNNFSYKLYFGSCILAITQPILMIIVIKLNKLIHNLNAKKTSLN